LVQDVCHWLSVRCSFVSIEVSSFIWREFSSKNSILSFSMLSCGMGFRILGGLFVLSCVGRAKSVLGGICSVTGEWSEFRLYSWFVVDVYSVLLGVWI
jgi:hypothetical protein